MSHHYSNQLFFFKHDNRPKEKDARIEIFLTCSFDPTGTKTTLCVCNSGAFFPTVITLRSSKSKGSRMVESFSSSTTKSGIRKSNLPTIVESV